MKPIEKTPGTRAVIKLVVEQNSKVTAVNAERIVNSVGLLVRVLSSRATQVPIP